MSFYIGNFYDPIIAGIWEFNLGWSPRSPPWSRKHKGIKLKVKYIYLNLQVGLL